MREILFRGKHVSSGKWIISPSLRQEEDGSIYLLVKRTWYCVGPETVGQYTGLTDKNDTKIFEGDIVKSPRYVNSSEAWDIGTICFGEYKQPNNISKIKYVHQGFYIDWSSDDISRNMRSCALSRNVNLEVIGNIHDNPELLEVEE